MTSDREKQERVNEQAVEAERAVVLSMLVGGGEAHARSRAWLYARSSFSAEEIDRAIGRLKEAGVLTASPRMIRPLPTLGKLDSLRLIGP